MAAQAKEKPLPIGKGKIGYTTSNVFRAPLKKVWEAATQKKHLMKHFVDDASGDLGVKKGQVTWTWHGFGSGTVEVIKYAKYKEIVFTSPSPSGKYQITVRFEFLRKNGRTIFRVHDSGYQPKDLKFAFMMCEGWSEFHTGIKAYLAGKDLRKY